LAGHQDQVEGAWVQLATKAAARPGLTHAAALEEALCFGWIDGVGRKLDAQAWMIKFTPRRRTSLWSKRNTLLAERLISEGRMMPRGLAEVTAAKADGRWARAYVASSEMKVPADFLAALRRHPAAMAFFKSLNRANHYAIVFRLTTAMKPETRARRFAALLQAMIDGKRLH
jgi:uncharacterized protein YdeI (YjbR/CyaY-like superfamily)